MRRRNGVCFPSTWAWVGLFLFWPVECDWNNTILRLDQKKKIRHLSDSLFFLSLSLLSLGTQPPLYEKAKQAMWKDHIQVFLPTAPAKVPADSQHPPRGVCGLTPKRISAPSKPSQPIDSQALWNKEKPFLLGPVWILTQRVWEHYAVFYLILFPAALGLRCCAQAFFSCSKWC